jgi:hypothetical protein
LLFLVLTAHATNVLGQSTEPGNEIGSALTSGPHSSSGSVNYHGNICNPGSALTHGQCGVSSAGVCNGQPNDGNCNTAQDLRVCFGPDCQTAGHGTPVNPNPNSDLHTGNTVIISSSDVTLRLPKAYSPGCSYGTAAGNDGSSLQVKALVIYSGLSESRVTVKYNGATPPSSTDPDCPGGCSAVHCADGAAKVYDLGLITGEDAMGVLSFSRDTNSADGGSFTVRLMVIESPNGAENADNDVAAFSSNVKTVTLVEGNQVNLASAQHTVQGDYLVRETEFSEVTANMNGNDLGIQFSLNAPFYCSGDGCGLTEGDRHRSIVALAPCGTMELKIY